MSVFNNEKDVNDAVKSILNQTYNNFEFLNLEETPQGYSQIVRITDQNDKLFLLKYFMKNVAGIWKISGVSIIEASDFSA